ncbi:MAG: hypothetical protein R8J94_22525 [Acidimicrobiia bacterium]|nr:hypothetical protein [Acidimicrobiia bacterium]
MKKILSALATVALLTVTFASAAGAQDPVVGTVVSDPASVPEAGEHTVTATGTGYLPDSALLLGSCTSPADELVFGEASAEDIGAAAGAIGIADCDLATAIQVTTDADGSFTQEVTADIGANFFLTAATLDQSQQGAVWIPIVDPEAAAALAVTGVESSTLALVGAALMLMGMVAVAGARRSEI